MPSQLAVWPCRFVAWASRSTDSTRPSSISYVFCELLLAPLLVWTLRFDLDVVARLADVAVGRRRLPAAASGAVVVRVALSPDRLVRRRAARARVGPAPAVAGVRLTLFTEPRDAPAAATAATLRVRGRVGQDEQSGQRPLQRTRAATRAVDSASSISVLPSASSRQRARRRLPPGRAIAWASIFWAPSGASNVKSPSGTLTSSRLQRLIVAVYCGSPGSLDIADDELARQGLLARVDPDLPFDGVLREGEVVARDARRLVDAQVAPVGHALHQHGVGIGVQEVGERQHDAVLVLELVERRVDRRRRLDRGVDVVLLVEHRDRPAVVPGGAIERVARRVGRHVVRALHGDPPDVRQLSPELAVGELVERLLRLQREVRQLREELAHLLRAPGRHGPRPAARAAAPAAGAGSWALASGARAAAATTNHGLRFM